jgi:hypothetical protein
MVLKVTPLSSLLSVVLTPPPSLSIDPSLHSISQGYTHTHVHEQAAWIAIGLPPTVFLTLKLCDENGFGPWRQAAQLIVQAALTLELWHLMIR